MSRGIDIEITSRRDDDTFTWRAAGARQPKGVVAVATLPTGTGVGDVVKVEIEVGLDGTEVLGPIHGRPDRRVPETIELHAAPIADDALVTTKLAPKGRGGRRGDGERRGRRDDRRHGDVPRSSEDRPPRRRRERSAESDGERRGSERRERPPTPPRPKVPRLRPARTHRDAALAALEPAERPIAEQVLKGGIQAVRQGIDRQNEKARAQGEPEIKAQGILDLAEKLLPTLRTAEWHDRADAAIAGIDDVDLKDLRSVVVASQDHAKTEETRALAAELRTKLAERVEREQATWLADLDTALTDGRVIRALKISSRPPKAGEPIPAELAARIATAATDSLTLEVSQTRWIAVIDALAYSPVRLKVVPDAVPAEVTPDLREIITRFASLLPELALKFGIDPATAPAKPPRRPHRPRRKTSATSAAPAAEESPADESTETPTTPPAGVADAPTQEGPRT